MTASGSALTGMALTLRERSVRYPCHPCPWVAGAWDNTRRVHPVQPNRPRVLDDLATLGYELLDALRQGPILAALLLLMALLAIQVLVALVAPR
jgi:hypothetical protein